MPPKSEVKIPAVDNEQSLTYNETLCKSKTYPWMLRQEEPLKNILLIVNTDYIMNHLYKWSAEVANH